MLADTIESLVKNDKITWFYASYYIVDRTWEYRLNLKLLHIFSPHQNPEGHVPLQQVLAVTSANLISLPLSDLYVNMPRCFLPSAGNKQKHSELLNADINPCQLSDWW